MADTEHSGLTGQQVLVKSIKGLLNDGALHATLYLFKDLLHAMKKEKEKQ